MHDIKKKKHDLNPALQEFTFNAAVHTHTYMEVKILTHQHQTQRFCLSEITQRWAGLRRVFTPSRPADWFYEGYCSSRKPSVNYFSVTWTAFTDVFQMLRVFWGFFSLWSIHTVLDFQSYLLKIIITSSEIKWVVCFWFGYFIGCVFPLRIKFIILKLLL